MARWTGWGGLPIVVAAASACLHSPPSPPSSGDGGPGDGAVADSAPCSAPSIDQLIDDFDEQPELAWEMIGTSDPGCSIEFFESDLIIERSFGQPCYVRGRQAYDLGNNGVYISMGNLGSGMPDLTFGVTGPKGQALYAIWTSGIVSGCYTDTEEPCPEPHVLAGQADLFWRLSHHDNALWAHTHNGQAWNPEVMIADGVAADEVSCVAIFVGSVATTGEATIRVDGINVDAP